MKKQRFQKYTMVMSPPVLTIENVSYLNEELWMTFQNFYILCLNNKTFIENYDRPLPGELVRASYRFFKQIKKGSTKLNVKPWLMADQYFENFTPIWNLSGRRNKKLWHAVLKTVRNWEKQNNYELHKGTLFYFWATSDLLKGDYDEGFILMHKALEEDRRKAGNIRAPDTPGHDFVSMNEKPGGYLQPLTNSMINFLKRRLERYIKERNGKLDYKNLRSKFLDNKDRSFEDLKFFFSYITLKWIRLRLIHSKRDIADEQMAPLIFANVISSLLLITDELYKVVFKSKYKGRQKIYFSNHVKELAKDLGWATNKKNYLSLIKNSELNAQNFEKIIRSLLNGSYKNNNGKTLQPLEADLVLSYRLRNFSAHSLKSQKFLWDKFTEVLQAILNTFFLGIERS